MSERKVIKPVERQPKNLEFKLNEESLD